MILSDKSSSQIAKKMAKITSKIERIPNIPKATHPESSQLHFQLVITYLCRHTEKGNNAIILSDLVASP